MEVYGEGEGEGEEEGEGTLRALESIEFLNHDTELSGKTLIEACNGFNELSRLEILWTVWHICPEGVRFTFG